MTKITQQINAGYLDRKILVFFKLHPSTETLGFPIKNVVTI